MRRARGSDCKLLFEWANDAEVRQGAFQSEPIPWSEHCAWFAMKMNSSDAAIYIAEDDKGNAVGQVRFDIKPDGSAETDISVAAFYRGRGLGSDMLRAAITEFVKMYRVREIVAQVKEDNEASQRVFVKAGFVSARREPVKGRQVVRFVYLSSDNGIN